MMSKQQVHVPISRESMRILRAQKEEERRIQQVEGEIAKIYQSAIRTAENTNDSRYLHPLDSPFRPPLEFYKMNMAEILAGVQYLFPGCSVKHTTRDAAPYAGGYIVVDWS